MGVVAISGDEIIIVPCGCECAGYNRFLSDVKMTKAADLLRLILLTGAFLETANHQHQREHFDLVALHPWLHGDYAGRARAEVLREAASALRLKRTHMTKSAVNNKSLRSELRKNIHVGVALYCGRPTVRAWMRPPRFLA